MARHYCAAMALTFLLTACADDPTAPFEPPNPQAPSPGMVTALVDGYTYASGTVDVRQGGGLIYIHATGWPENTDDRHYLDLTFESTASLARRVIGVDQHTTATYTIEFWGGWIANSGTITLTTLTADRATGTFNFSGPSNGRVTPPVLEVTKGWFDVRLQ